ncbi:MAG: isoamylase early set domain-containing protein [Desulfonatronovibrio sp.]|nr:isoamylase early set domain-containing protein [Desulfovibrionales bacterium]
MRKYNDLNIKDIPAARLIASLKYQNPPDKLLSGVMSRIAPPAKTKKLSLSKWLLTPRPIRLAPIWPISGLAAAMLILVTLTYITDETGKLEQNFPLKDTAIYSDETFHVLFSFDNPDVDSVSIMGSFNDWNPAGYVLRQSNDGIWTITIPLPKGSHEYAFVINDEQIVPDPDALLFKDDGFGSVNSMIVIEDYGYEQQT